MRILLVEDEAKIAAFLRKELTENGFVVDLARQGDSGHPRRDVPEPRRLGGPRRTGLQRPRYECSLA